MKILHMIGVYYMSKQDKLTRKRKHIQITRILRKPRSYWHEKNRAEDCWLGGEKLVKKLQLVAGKKVLHDKRKFHEIINKDFSSDIA